MIDNKGQYTIHQFVNGKSTYMQKLDDPFHHTTTKIRLSPIAAIKAMFGGLVIVTALRGSSEAHRVVFTGDYTPATGPSESMKMIPAKNNAWKEA